MKNICCWRCISVKTNLKPMEFPDYNDKNVVGYSGDKEDGDANERNGIYVADDAQTIPTQPIKSDTTCTQLPMVSIQEDHPSKRNKKEVKRNIKSKKRNHRTNFSTVSAVVSAEPDYFDDLQNSY